MNTIYYIELVGKIIIEVQVLVSMVALATLKFFMVSLMNERLGKLRERVKERIGKLREATKYGCKGKITNKG